MELRRTLLTGIFGMVALNILTAFGAVGLLVRMSPVVGKIVSENVKSLEAVEQMFAVLALSADKERAVLALVQFDTAMRTAEENVTEAEERPVIQRIEATRTAALEGAAEARTELVGALKQLAELNRQAMRTADEEAQRQGDAGAWFAVICAVASLVVSAIIARRLTQKLVEPLGHLYRVLETFRTGQRHRRCTAADVPPEFRLIFDSVNSLLDDKHQRMQQP